MRELKRLDTLTVISCTGYLCNSPITYDYTLLQLVVWVGLEFWHPIVIDIIAVQTAAKRLQLPKADAVVAPSPESRRDEMASMLFCTFKGCLGVGGRKEIRRVLILIIIYIYHLISELTVPAISKHQPVFIPWSFVASDSLWYVAVLVVFPLTRPLGSYNCICYIYIYRYIHV